MTLQFALRAFVTDKLYSIKYTSRQVVGILGETLCIYHKPLVYLVEADVEP